MCRASPDLLPHDQALAPRTEFARPQEHPQVVLMMALAAQDVPVQVGGCSPVRNVLCEIPSFKIVPWGMSHSAYSIESSEACTSYEKGIR